MEKLIVLSVLSAISFLDVATPYEYFDLGYDLDSTNLFFPGQRFNYTLFKDIEIYNFTIPDHIRYHLSMYSFCMGEHGGTHLDAPFHLNEFGWKLNEIPIDRLVDIPAVVVDIEAEVFGSANPNDFTIEIGHVLEHERKYGKIPFGAVVIFHTGWGERYWPDFQKYFGADKKTGTFNFPGLSENLAKWLVQERKIVGVGIDTSSADIGNTEKIGGSRAHLVLCGNNVYIIENMTNLKRLLQAIRRYKNVSSSATVEYGHNLRLIVMPIKSRGSGGPGRVVAYFK